MTVTTGQSVAAPPVALKAIGRLAHVSGSFDQMEKFHRTNLGNTIDEIQASQLGSASVLNQFKMIFLNCGLDEKPADDPAVIQALLAWVRAGGVLYASDWALKYVRAMLPCDVPEIEDFHDEDGAPPDQLDLLRYYVYIE